MKVYVEYNSENDEKLTNEAFEGVKKERKEGMSGYYELPDVSVEIIEKIKKSDFAEFDTVAVIGIGGSSLGTKAVDTFLKHKNKKEIIFLENPDPVDLKAKVSYLKTKKPLFIVISKSGRTIETLSIFKLIYKEFDFQKNKERFIAISDANSHLHQFAQKEGIKHFEIPANVGGRFSVLSAVGIVPLSLAGYDTHELLKGAGEIRDLFFEKKEESILKKAVFVAKNWEKYRMNVLFSYGNFFEDFNKWYVQLWGESLGKIDKNGKNTGPTPIGHIGSVDQHSFLQLVVEGPKDKTLTFLCVKDLEKLTIPDISLEYLSSSDFVNGVEFGTLLNEECEATMKSVQEKNIPVDRIEIESLCEKSIGKLLFYYELFTSCTGVLLGINTYNQPGVERGKEILKTRFSNN